MDRAARVLWQARSSGVKLVVCESMTGGLLSSLLTDPSGASDVFSFGLVVYSGLAKSSLLGVPNSLLSSKGEVSAEVASSMLRGLLSRAASSGLTREDGTRVLGLALTGNAGRDAGRNAGRNNFLSESSHSSKVLGEEVGLLYLAAGFSGCTERIEEHRLALQGRRALRHLAAKTSLQLLSRLLETSRV